MGQPEHDPGSEQQARKDHGEEAEEPCVDADARADDHGEDEDRPDDEGFPPGPGEDGPLGPTNAMLLTHVSWFR